MPKLLRGVPTHEDKQIVNEVTVQIETGVDISKHSHNDTADVLWSQFHAPDKRVSCVRGSYVIFGQN